MGIIASPALMKLKAEYRLILAAIVIGILGWMADAFLANWLYYHGSFWRMLFAPPAHEIYDRLVLLITLLAMGVMAARLLAARKRGEQALHQAKDQLEIHVGERTQQWEAANLALQREIAERKQAEAELRQHREHLEELVQKRTVEVVKTHERLFEILETISDSFISLDHEWRFTYLNRRALQFAGKSLGQVLGRTIWEVFPQIVGTPLESQYRKAMAERQPMHFENLSEVSAGNWFDLSIYPTADGLAIIGRDITEHRQAEEALRESAERLRRSQEIAHLGSWELDLVNNRLSWSDEVYRIFGLRPQEFGATYEAFLEAVHPDDRAAVNAAYSGSLREGRDFYEIEHRIVRKASGEIRTVLEKCEHIRDSSGRIVRSIGMVHDITTRKQMEEQVASLAKFPLENSNPVIRVNEQGIILYANPASQPVLTEWGVATGSEVPAPWKDRVLMALQGNYSHEADIACAQRQFSFTVVPVREQGYVNLYGTDITARKLAEEKVKASLKEKEVLLREVHHRVKNNLQIIYSLLNLQADRIEHPGAALLLRDSQDRIQSIALVHEQLYRSEDLASVRFADYLRTITQYLLNSYGVDTQQVCLAVDAQNIALPVDIALPCGLIVHELISNALKHAFPDGRKGKISIELHDHEGEHAVLHIADDGVGFPEYFNLVESKTLGLQLAFGLANQLGGRLELAKQPSADFKLTFIKHLT